MSRGNYLVDRDHILFVTNLILCANNEKWKCQLETYQKIKFKGLCCFCCLSPNTEKWTIGIPLSGHYEALDLLCDWQSTGTWYLLLVAAAWKIQSKISPKMRERERERIVNPTIKHIAGECSNLTKSRLIFGLFLPSLFCHIFITLSS